MKTNKKEYIVLIISIISAFLIHLAPFYYHSFILNSKILKAKQSFNDLLKDNSVDTEILKCLKILINNYESLEDESVLNSGNLEELQDAVENIKIQTHDKILKYSPLMTLSMLGSVTITPIVFSLKKLASSN